MPHEQAGRGLAFRGSRKFVTLACNRRPARCVAREGQRRRGNLKRCGDRHAGVGTEKRDGRQGQAARYAALPVGASGCGPCRR